VSRNGAGAGPDRRRGKRRETPLVPYAGRAAFSALDGLRQMVYPLRMQVLTYIRGSSMDNHRSAKERLMTAAVELMAEKGYDGTTTKEIAAAAGVNEITLFRHFGSKQQLLEQVFRSFHYGDEMTALFREALTGDLHRDLLLISRTYHRIMNRNRKLLSIALKGSGQLPQEVYREAGRHPQILRDLLTGYFADMAAKKKVYTPNPEMTALSFMWMNYGAFVSGLEAKRAAPEDKIEAFIEESVRLFVKALTP